MKSAVVYKKPNKYILHSQSVTTDGILLATGPFFVLPIETPHFEIVEYICRCIQESKSSLPQPKNWVEYQKSFLKFCRESSAKKLSESALVCLVHFRNSTFIFEPTRNLGSKQGLEELTGQEVTVPFSKAVVVLTEALNRCV